MNPLEIKLKTVEENLTNNESNQDLNLKYKP